MTVLLSVMAYLVCQCSDCCQITFSCCCTEKNLKEGGCLWGYGSRTWRAQHKQLWAMATGIVDQIKGGSWLGSWLRWQVGWRSLKEFQLISQEITWPNCCMKLFCPGCRTIKLHGITAYYKEAATDCKTGGVGGLSRDLSFPETRKMTLSIFKTRWRGTVTRVVAAWEC